MWGRLLTLICACTLHRLTEPFDGRCQFAEDLLVLTTHSSG